MVYEPFLQKMNTVKHLKKFNSLGSPSKILIIAAKYVFTQILK